MRCAKVKGAVDTIDDPKEPSDYNEETQYGTIHRLRSYKETTIHWCEEQRNECSKHRELEFYINLVRTSHSCFASGENEMMKRNVNVKRNCELDDRYNREDPTESPELPHVLAG